MVNRVAAKPGDFGDLCSLQINRKEPDNLPEFTLRNARTFYIAVFYSHDNRLAHFKVPQVVMTPKKNLFSKIDDLAGVRLLHIHTDQIENINRILKKIFDDEKYILLKGPVANTWDVEYENFFKGLSIRTKTRPTTLYTSVHYVIGSNNKYKTRCEIQVRTLMEEVWGEVSHSINYPEPTAAVCCKEQIKVLARATSSCTRLVDSIFKSHNEHNRTRRQGRKK